MQDSGIPTKFSVVWGASAGAGYIRTVPVASQIGIQNGAASFTDGFPPLTFLPVGSGGVPPFGQDFNGINNVVTAWEQWYQAGGPIGYDSVFSTAIGGYPNGALLKASGFTGYWQSTVDNNSSDPDTGGANWIPMFPGGQARLITASGAFTTNLTDQSVGLARAVSPGVSSTTLPAAAVGKIFRFADLQSNAQAYPITISPPAGQTFAGLSSVAMDVNRQVLECQYFGSNLWSVKY